MGYELTEIFLVKVSNEIFPSFGANIISDYYLPSFHHFFKESKIAELTHKEKFMKSLKRFQKAIDEICKL